MDDDEYSLVDSIVYDVAGMNEILMARIDALTDAYINERLDEPLEYVVFDMYDQGLISKRKVVDLLDLMPHEFHDRAIYYRRIRAEKVV